MPHIKQAIRKQKKAINFQYDMQHFLRSAIVLDHFYFAFSTLFSFFSFSLRVTILADQNCGAAGDFVRHRCDKLIAILNRNSHTYNLRHLSLQNPSIDRRIIL